MEGAPVKIKDAPTSTPRKSSSSAAAPSSASTTSSPRPAASASSRPRRPTTSNCSTGSTARVKPTDLFEFGLIPEFAGRLPIVASLKPLSREMLVRVMTEPANSIYGQYRQILRNDGVELVIEPQVFVQIADMAMEYKVGARSLRGIFEELLTPVIYLVPDHPEVQQVRISSLFENPRFIGARPPA
jgi:ATP-dependent protease Clp ATPase subunit